MKKYLGIVIVAGALLMAGCAGIDETVQNNSKEVTTQYRGADLHCIQTNYDRSATLTCDFERFYAENPLFTR